MAYVKFPNLPDVLLSSSFYTCIVWPLSLCWSRWRSICHLCPWHIIMSS